MNDHSIAIVVGRLTSKPLLHYTKPAGVPFVHLKLAVRQTAKDGAGTVATRTTHVTVLVWRRLAELCSQFLKRGRPVMVVGKLAAGSSMTIEADRVQFLGPRDTEPSIPTPDSTSK